MKKSLHQVLSILLPLLLAGAAQAQINLSTLSYSQDFNSLGSVNATWTDNATIQGWYAANNNAGVVTPYTAFTVGAGGGTSSSTLYALGVSGDSERSLGGAPASTRYSIIGLRLINDTGSVFNSIQVQYDLEQWSDRGTATITLSYQSFAPGAEALSTLTGWTTLNTTGSPLPVNATPVSGIGNTTGLLAGILAGSASLNVAPGDELWLRWEITKIAGQNATHGIDNVLVSVPEPSTGLLIGLGLLALAGRQSLARRG